MKTKYNEYLSRAEKYMDADKIEKAKDLLFRCIKINPDKAEAYAQLAACFMTREDYVQGLKWADQAVDKDPYCSAAYFYIGRIYYRMEKYSEAISHLKITINLEPDIIEAYIQLANCYSDIKDYDQALNWLNQAKERFPNCYLAYFCIGYILYQKEEYQEATSYLKRALYSGIKTQHTYDYLIFSEIHSNKNSDAYIHLKEAIKLYPDSPYYNISLASVIIENGEEIGVKSGSEVIKYLDKADQHNYEPRLVQILMGKYYQSLGDWDKAIHCFNESLKISEDSDVSLMVVQSLIKAGKNQEAIKLVYAQAAKGNPLAIELMQKCDLEKYKEENSKNIEIPEEKRNGIIDKINEFISKNSLLSRIIKVKK